MVYIVKSVDDSSALVILLDLILFTYYLKVDDFLMDITNYITSVTQSHIFFKKKRNTISLLLRNLLWLKSFSKASFPNLLIKIF